MEEALGERVEEDLGEPDWRPVVAALANPHARRVFAQVVLGAGTDEPGLDLGHSRRRRALLELVAERSLAEGEVVCETELNEDLLVDQVAPQGSGVRSEPGEPLERTRSGSQYARTR